MPDFLKIVLAVLGILAFPTVSRAGSAKPPNVLFILVDDMGWGDPSCYGGIGVATPAMDGLAKDGMRFTRFYTASPICSASRCGFITGRFPARAHITSFLHERAENRKCEQADFLNPAAPSFVRAFHEAGYTTAHIGKWHLGGGRDVTDAPKFSAYGYDLGLGTYESPEPAPALGIHTVPWGEKLEPQQVPRHDRTRWMVDRTLEFAKNHPGKPWLVNLWLDDVHTPHRPSADQRKAVKKGKGTLDFRAVLKETDRQIGRLLDGLREMGAADNTIVIFAGDNGPAPSFKHARTGGLRGMKLSLYEGGVRTPFIVRWPGKIPAGAVNETTIFSGVDLYPTLCRLAGIEIPRKLDLDGENLSASLLGEAKPRTKPLFFEYGRNPNSFSFPPNPADKSPNVATLQGNWKLLVNANGSDAQLYDISKDPEETTNLVDSEYEVAKRLTAAALKWRKDLP